MNSRNLRTGWLDRERGRTPLTPENGENPVVDSSQATALNKQVSGSISASTPACHAGERGSTPRQRDSFSIFIRDRLVPCPLHGSHLNSIPNNESGDRLRCHMNYDVIDTKE